MSNAVVAMVSLVEDTVAVCGQDMPAASFDKYSVYGPVGRNNVVELSRASCLLRHSSFVAVDWLGAVDPRHDEGSIHHRRAAS